jgi:hypothetical protein
MVVHHGHVRTIMMRHLARLIVDKRYHRAIFVFNEAFDMKPYGFSDIIRILPELHHAGFAGDVSFVVKPVRRYATARQFIEQYYPADGLPVLDGILSKYGPIRWEDVLARITVLAPGEEYRADSTARGVCVFSSDADAVLWTGATNRHRGAGGDAIALANGPHARRYGITSLCPDYEMMGYQLAHYIVGDFPVTKSRRGYLDVALQMFFRKTTSGG